MEAIAALKGQPVIAAEWPWVDLDPGTTNTDHQGTGNEPKKLLCILLHGSNSSRVGSAVIAFLAFYYHLTLINTPCALLRAQDKHMQLSLARW